MVIARDGAPTLLPTGLDREVARVAGAVRAAVEAQCEPQERVRAGIAALLGALGSNPDCTWWWVAIWPAGPGDDAERLRLQVEAELVDAFASAAVPREVAVAVLRDGWRLVHERLWCEAEPALSGLVDPLMALLALRRDGLGAVCAALAAA